MCVHSSLPIMPFRQITDDEAICYLMEIQESEQRQHELFAARQYLDYIDEAADVACFVRAYKEAHSNPIGFE